MGSWNSVPTILPAQHILSSADLQPVLDLAQVTPELYRVGKSSDESVTSSTTIQDDDELQLAVAANAEYEMLAYLIYDGATAGDLKFGFAGPASATLDWVQGGLLNSADAQFGSIFSGANTIASTAIVTGAGSGTNNFAAPSGRLLTSSTAGIFKLQWAQGTSSATATRVRAGSYLRLMRVG